MNPKTEHIVDALYRWEVPLRGWTLYDEPVDLQPPFVPYWYYINETSTTQDDGRLSLSGGIKKLFQPKSPKPEEAEVIMPFADESQVEWKTYRLTLPNETHLKAPSAYSFIEALKGSLHPISFELIGTRDEIIVLISCEFGDDFWLTTIVKAHFPSLRLHPFNEALPFDVEQTNIAIIDFGLNEEVTRPLNANIPDIHDDYSAFFSLASGLEVDECIMLQTVFNGVNAPWSYHIKNCFLTANGSSFFSDAPEMTDLAQRKTESSLFACSVRIAAQGGSQSRSAHLARILSQDISNKSNSQHNQLIPLSNEGYHYDNHFDNLVNRKSNRSGMLLNANELRAWVHVPSESLEAQSLSWRGISSEVPDTLVGNQYVIGHSDGTEVSVSNQQRNRHSHILGVSGTGKTSFLANLLLSDISQGNGVILLDGHGDIVNDLLMRIPEERLNDVVLLDPASNDFALGWNILEAQTEQEKIIISSDLIDAFKRESTSWGDVIHSIFSNAIYAFLESTRGGSLLELKRFLIEEDFREEFLTTIDDEQLQYYWTKEFPLHKSNAITPLLTRLDTFLRPKVVRKVLTQQQGINISECIESKKIVLIKLAQGEVGEANSRILGTLFLSKIYQAFLARQRLNIEQRHLVPVVVDECHNYITETILQMLSGARKYGLALHLAHQNTAQLKTEFRQTIDANTSIKVLFRLGYSDVSYATNLIYKFDEDDFQTLGLGEAIVRVGVRTDVVKIKTLPPTQSLYPSLDSVLVKLNKAPQEENEVVSKPLEIITPKTTKVVEAVKPKVDVGDKVAEVKQQLKERSELTKHRQIQTVLKKCGQDNGFKSVIEAPIKGSDNKVDLALTRDDMSIAVEISVTNTVDYEIGNIQKCIDAGFTTILMVSDDLIHLTAIKTAFAKSGGDTSTLHFYSSQDALKHLNGLQKPKDKPEFHMIKGYRVKIEYKDSND